jgi:hypothetical protein
MAIGSREEQDLTSLLRIIFEESLLQISLTGETDKDRARKIAFYDEVIGACIRFSIPASHRTIPRPDSSSRNAFALPLEIGDEEEDDNDEQREERAPVVLALLIASLRVSLEAAYVPPRLARDASDSLQRDEVEAGDIQLIPSVEADDLAYQNVSLQTGTPTSEATRMVYKDWSGNAAPPKPELKRPCSMKGRDAFSATAEGTSSANVWFGKVAEVESWIVEWRCDIPIVFLRSRHPTPALILNATLTLLLQSSKLSLLAPSLVPPATTSASEAVFLHDLLNPLSEGPAYPDESPAERAARADASLAKLPLGKLPSSILGSKLVTPARGANDLAKMLNVSHHRVDGGDVGSSDSKDTRSGNVDKGLGEEATIVKRSVRKALDVRSAVQVRMRTTNIAGIGQGFGQKETQQDSEQDSIVPTLVLCVEIENPSNSGIEFALDDIGVQVALPSESYGALHPAKRIQVSATPIGFVPDSLTVTQGSQYNLLFRVDFALPNDLVAAEALDPSALLTETQRTITIELFGHPIFLTASSSRKDAKDAEAASAKSFTSTWSCTLDFVTQIQALVLQRVVADGAGGVNLAGSHTDADIIEPLSTSTAAVPPSVVAQRRLESLQQLDTNMPLREALPRLQTQARMPSNTLPASRTIPARAGSVAQNGESFISLQQIGRIGSNSGDGVSGPALPSSLAGPSILARARKNRHATTSNLPNRTDDSRSASLIRGQRAATLVSTPSASFDQDEQHERGHRRLPSRVASTSYHVKNAMSGSFSNGSLAHALPVYPLGIKGSWARMPYMLRNASREQGVLLDVTAIRVRDDTTTDGQGVIEVQMQIDNRSEITRTILLQWKRSSGQREAEEKFSTDLLSQGWMPSDDAVQVGPIAPGQAELSMMRLAKRENSTSTTTSSPYTIPPLILTDIGSGMQRTLISVQQLC